MIINLLGWIGTTLLAAAGLPQLYKVVKEGHAFGLAWFYLVLVLTGMICMLTYVILTSFDIQLMVSYIFQMIVFGILIYRKRFPKTTNLL